MKLSTLVALTCMLCFALGGQAQSLFKPLPKPMVDNGRKKLNIVDTLTPGANYSGLRFTGPTVLYAVNTTTFQQSAVFTGVGVDYESDTWDAASGKFYTNWAVGLQAMEGGQFAPSSVSAVTAAGLTLSTQKIGSWQLPFKFTVGFIYNFTTKASMWAVGPGVTLNN